MEFAGKMRAFIAGAKTRARCRKKISKHLQPRLLAEINTVHRVFLQACSNLLSSWQVSNEVKL